jgi:hypothetical protein
VRKWHTNIFFFHRFLPGNTNKSADSKTKIWRQRKSAAGSPDLVQ